MIRPSDLPKVTIQIYRVGEQLGETYDVIPHASGVLFEINGCGFLLSAAHNFDQENIKGLGFLNKKSELIIFQGELSRFSTDDPINMPADIAVYRLTKDTIADLIEDGYQFISNSDIIINKAYRLNGRFHIFGYPSSKSKKNRKKLIISRKSFYFISKLKHIPKIQHYDPMVNLPIDWHYRKLKSSNNRRVHSCKPEGLSGCGLWYDDGNKLKLIGIMISYNKIHSILMGTAIDLAMEIIRIKFDSSAPKTKLIKLKYQ